MLFNLSLDPRRSPSSDIQQSPYSTLCTRSRVYGTRARSLDEKTSSDVHDRSSNRLGVSGVLSRLLQVPDNTKRSGIASRCATTGEAYRTWTEDPVCLPALALQSKRRTSHLPSPPEAPFLSNYRVTRQAVERWFFCSVVYSHPAFSQSLRTSNMDRGVQPPASVGLTNPYPSSRKPSLAERLTASASTSPLQPPNGPSAAIHPNAFSPLAARVAPAPHVPLPQQFWPAPNTTFENFQFQSGASSSTHAPIQNQNQNQRHLGQTRAVPSLLQRMQNPQVATTGLEPSFSSTLR